MKHLSQNIEALSADSSVPKELEAERESRNVVFAILGIQVWGGDFLSANGGTKYIQI